MLCNKRFTKIRSFFLAAILSISTITGPLTTAASAATAKANLIVNGVTATKKENAVEHGKISVVSLSSSLSITQGKSFTVSISPDSGYGLKTFKVNGEDKTNDVAEISLFGLKFTGYAIPASSVGANVDISIAFAKSYSISVNVDSSSTLLGTTDPAPLSVLKWQPDTALEGEDFTLTLKPFEGFEVSSLKLDGADVTADVVNNKYTLENVSADHAFAVSFKPVMHTVTVSAPEGVTIDTEKTFEVSHLATKTIGIEATEGYRITSVKVNGIEELAAVILDNKLTLPLIAEDKNIVIAAEKGTYRVATEIIPNLDGKDHGTITESTTVEHGDNLEITVTPDEHYELKSLIVTKGLNVKDVVADVVDNKYTIENITKDVTVVATFAKKLEYTLTVNSTEDINVYPESIIPGIPDFLNPLPAVYTQPVGYEDSKTFTLAPKEGYEITKVKINGKSQEIDKDGGTITVNITEDTTIDITSKIKTFVIGAISTDPLRGIVTPLATIKKYGEEYTLKITPFTGYEIDKVTLDGIIDITSRVKDNTYTDSKVTADALYTVSFKKKSYTITVDAPENISVDPADTTITAEYLDTKTFTITPKDAYHDIESISINGKKLNAVELALVKSTNKLVLPLISENKDIVITSKESAYDVKTSVLGEGGTITKGKIVKRGNDFLIKVTPDDYYEVDTFTVDGKPAKLVAGYYLLNNVTENHEIEVSFKLVKHTVNVRTTWGATVTPIGTFKVEHGSDQDIAIAAMHNYEIKGVFVNGKFQTLPLVDDTLHLKNISRNTNVVVVADKVAHDITTKVYGEHGTISDGGNVADGESFTVTATPDEGFKVKAIYVNGRKVKFEDNSYTIKAVKRDTKIVATFTEYLPSITLNTSEGVEISTEVPAEVTYGSDLELKIAAKAGYYLTSIKVNGVKVGLPLDEDTLTISNITEDTIIEVQAAVILAPDTGKGVLVGENATPHMLATIIVAAMASVAALLKKRGANR